MIFRTASTGDNRLATFSLALPQSEIALVRQLDIHNAGLTGLTGLARHKPDDDGFDLPDGPRKRGFDDFDDDLEDDLDLEDDDLDDDLDLDDDELDDDDFDLGDDDDLDDEDDLDEFV